MLSDDFPLAEGTFVHYRDSLYEHYFKQDFTSHADFLHEAAVCYAEVVNYHQRMNYAMGEKEYNDQVWFMAEWIRQHKNWPIINGLDKELIASEIGTAIFHGLYAAGRLDTHDPAQMNVFWDTIRSYVQKYGPIVGRSIIRIVVNYVKAKAGFIPRDMFSI